jgi:serine phosphatase RsbU (regulator of sigma subunit)
MASPSQSSPKNGFTPDHAAGPYLGIQTVNVFVRDVERSSRFYVEQLGFRVISDVIIQSGQRLIGIAPPDGTAVLTLIAPAPDTPEFKKIGQPTNIVFVTEDVPAKYAEWNKRGVRFLHTPRLRRIKYKQQAEARLADNPGPVWGGVFTRFEDPDQNSFALVALDEVSRAIDAQRRAAAERLESERRAAHELEIAKEVQLKLFPQSMPLLGTLEYAGSCIQAHQVGGDYYDFLSLGCGHLGMVLSDISGKGIGAALLMANLQANLRTQFATALDDPERFLRSVNQLFYENTAESAYASLFYGDYDDQTRRLRYANCGHLSGLLLRSDGRLERLDSTCTVLGLFADWECSMSECIIGSGDTLALYTDGVTESLNASDEEYGEDRLVEVLRQKHSLSADALAASIVNAVQSFGATRQYDDITLIVAKGT